MQQLVRNGTDVFSKKDPHLNAAEDASVCNNKQRCNDDKCRWGYKESVDKGNRDKGFILNPTNCEYECEKLCDIGQYLGYESFKCRRELVDKLVEECTENIDEAKLAKITLAQYKNMCKQPCTLYFVLQ